MKETGGRGQAGSPSQEPRLVGLLGGRVGYSLSPVMHNEAFRALGLPFYYVTLSFEPQDLPLVIESLRRLDFAGANVTVPFKEAVIPYLDALAPEAAAAGSVNTLTAEGGRLVGHSTDGEGFVRACLHHGLGLKGASVLLIGAGGAGRAVAFAAVPAGVRRLALANRTASRAQDLARDLLRGHPGFAVEVVGMAGLAAAARGADLIVHAAAYGSEQGESPLPSRAIRREQAVLDLVYSPPLTPLLKEAAAAGARGFNGLSMLLYQGEASFRLWTGREAPHAVMAAALCRGAGLPEDRLNRSR